MDKKTANRKSSNKHVNQDVPQMEINISNTNSNSEIVINDLQLLNLLHLHPFLFSRAVRGYGEKDYEKWGWQQISKKFNAGYEGLKLNTPFTVEQLQSRWEQLRPVCPALAKACGKIPDTLWYTICKINRLLATKPRVIDKPMSPAQQYVLNQLPLMERLTDAQRRSLEVEVLDAIFTQERLIHLEPLNKKAQSFVQNQYEDFLKTIRIKELIPSSSKTSKTTTSQKSNTINEANPSSSINIVRCDENKLINSGAPYKSPTKQPIQASASPEIKTENYIFEAEAPVVSEGRTSSVDEQKLRFVPLKSVKYYTKKVRVRLKRCKLRR